MGIHWLLAGRGWLWSCASFPHLSHHPAGYHRNILTLMTYMQENKLIFKSLFTTCTRTLLWSKQAQCQDVGELHIPITDGHCKGTLKGVNAEMDEELGSLIESIPPHNLISMPSGIFDEPVFL